MDGKDMVPQRGGKPAVQDSFVRIGGIDFSGSVTCVFRSEPLKKDIAVLQFDLDKLDELGRQIRERSDENLAATGRRGCTTDDLYKLIGNFYSQKLKGLAAQNLEDVFQGRDSSTVNDIKKAWKSAGDSASAYVDGARDWTEGQLQGKVNESIEIGKQTLDNVGNHPFFKAIRKNLQESNQPQPQGQNESDPESV
jgi:hypothetical protein